MSDGGTLAATTQPRSGDFKMLAPIARSLRAAHTLVATARNAQSEIESFPVYGGETRIVKVTRNVVDAANKAVLDENGKTQRETVEVTVAVSVAARYAKATRNRRNAARRVRETERKFALVASTMSVDKVVAAIRKANS
jgi:hypothetical protein